MLLHLACGSCLEVSHTLARIADSRIRTASAEDSACSSVPKKGKDVSQTVVQRLVIDRLKLRRIVLSNRAYCR
jgi:hypothetical protein